MSIGTDVIKAALQRIGVHSVATPANPEAIDSGRLALNAMLELWLTYGIQIGFTPLDVPGDELNEPADCWNAIVDNLAVQISPDFDNGGNIVSPVLAARATAGFNHVRNIYQKHTIPKTKVSSTLPRGQGNQRRFYGDETRVFFDNENELDG